MRLPPNCTPVVAMPSRWRDRRFATVAEAVRYAIEDMPSAWLVGTFLDVDGTRFEGTAIRALYDASAYPGERTKTAA